MKTIQIDGVDYQADEKVIEELQGARRQLDAAQKDAAESKSKMEEITKAKDEAEKKLKESFSGDELEKAVQQGIKDHAEVYDKAKEFGIDVKPEMTSADIRKAVVDAAFKDEKFEADEMPAMYKAACKVLASNKSSQSKQLDGAGKNENDGLTREEILAKKLYNISNGIKEEK